MLKRNIYLQIDDINKTSEIKAMETRARRVTPIIDSFSEDYVVGIKSFEIPMDNIPILNFEENEYKVTLKWDGESVSEFLLFAPYKTSQIGATSGFIFQNSDFVMSLNDAFTTAYDALLILKPLLPALTAPFVTIENNVLNLYAEKSGYSSSIPLNIEIIFDHSLLNFYNCFNSFELGSDRHVIQIIDTMFNTVTFGAVDYLKIVQNFEILSRWNDLHKIQIVSDLPVNLEMIAGQSDVTRNVIADYLVNDSVNKREKFLYTPGSVIHWNDLNSSLVLNSYKIFIIAQFEDASVDVVDISPDHRFGLKIIFQDREINSLNLLTDEY